MAYLQNLEPLLVLQYLYLNCFPTSSYIAYFPFVLNILTALYAFLKVLAFGNYLVTVTVQIYSLGHITPNFLTSFAFCWQKMMLCDNGLVPCKDSSLVF